VTTLASTLPVNSTPTYSFTELNVSPSSEHIPVLVKQVVEGLDVKKGKAYIDGTLGGGGHTEQILRHCLPGGKVLAFDVDATAIKAARDRFRKFTTNLNLIHGSYSNMKEHACSINFGNVNGILLDLGFSSIQLHSSGKGFSFLRNEPLDMRFNTTGPKASELVNNMPQKELAHLIYTYGEERKSRVIAKAIVNNRPIHSSSQLAELILKILGRRKESIHPATRTFQALRIAVNSELDNLRQGLDQAISLLAPYGRLAVISYHSLEDRIVKTVFRQSSSYCICPTDLLVCICKHKPSIQMITRKVMKPPLEEVLSNPRSRSAKLRIVQKLPKEITHKS
jgi:16S rRNA (cytosine1402-N4)-methyltransferase